MSQRLQIIAETVTALFDEKEKAREAALSLHRNVIKCSGNAIKAIHRRQFNEASELLREGSRQVKEICTALAPHQDIFFAGFVQNAQKELAEARIFEALVTKQLVPTPEEVGVDAAPYLNGMGEAIGELRRYLLDNLRGGNFESLEEILDTMEDLYSLLFSMDYPEAMTLGLRRTTDVARSIIEKSRGDLTLTLQQKKLEKSLQRFGQELAPPSVGRSVPPLAGSSNSLGTNA